VVHVGGNVVALGRAAAGDDRFPLPSRPWTAPMAVSDRPPVPEYWAVSMDSLATWPVKSTMRQVFTETIFVFWRMTAGSLTQRPRSDCTATLSFSQS